MSEFEDMVQRIIKDTLRDKIEIIVSKQSFNLGDQYFDMVTGVEIWYDGEFIKEAEEND